MPVLLVTEEEDVVVVVVTNPVALVEEAEDATLDDEAPPALLVGVWESPHAGAEKKSAQIKRRRIDASIADARRAVSSACRPIIQSSS